MKNYGLQLRVQAQLKKQPTKQPIPTPLGFDDDDDDNVERDILRQAYKNKTHKDVEDQHKKALEEDPSVFDYDGVYEKMKEKQVRPVEHDRQDRKPRYIRALINKAKQREREHEVVYERKLAKERSKDEHLYADKDKFVTSAYKKKLAEQAKWMEEERLREMREEKEDVTKKSDLSDFYFNLAKNVAFGAGDAESRKSEKNPEKLVIHSTEQAPSTSIDTSLELPRPTKRNQDETEGSVSPRDVSPKARSEPGNAEPMPDSSTEDQVQNEPAATEQLINDHHKRSEDAVAAAKARFLARKKAKV